MLEKKNRAKLMNLISYFTFELSKIANYAIASSHSSDFLFLYYEYPKQLNI